MNATHIIKWIAGWNYTEIFYGILAAAIFALLAQWLGLLVQLRNKYRRRKAYKKYISSLVSECSLLIVIGKRKGFNLPDVYVQLDVARSDLMSAKAPDEASETPGMPNAYVLVGGPGAGKSTTIKKSVLDAIRRGRREVPLPLLLRLRDYVGFESLEHFAEHKLQAANFPEHSREIRSILQRGGCFCVLDGLDEVRPHLRSKVIEDINGFYHRHFLKYNRLIVTCRKEAYRSLPLDIPFIYEVRPLTDEQMLRFAQTWPPGFPAGKSKETFWRDINATPRIKELARSPLLLVGGLVQYTESNLGIPEERVEYLARVARWLVQDWATAQGHPPDLLRSAYDRLLARLAFEMHRQQCAEMSRDKVEVLIAQWLPMFGLQNMAPTDVLDSIAARTGILVSEEQHFVVFSQFGLQEYFASLELVSSVGEAKLATLEPKAWWREVILLAIAQQREPTQILESLFNVTPIVAAAAVAECPTPSISMQDKAIKTCLLSVDNCDKEVTGALVPLLRKVRGESERALCLELEKRIILPGASASIVGVCLATAGTEMATTILVRHPEVWDLCLKEAGYLSTSLENLLVDWISTGSEEQAERAINLLATRLSRDRLDQLLSILPSLPEGRASHLAKLLLEHVRRTTHTPEWREERLPLALVARCVPYIRDRENYITSLITKTSQQSQDSQRAFNPYYIISKVGLILTCVTLEKRSKHLYTEREITSTIAAASRWAVLRGSYLTYCISVATYFVFIHDFHFFPQSVLMFLITGAACTFITYDRTAMPWKRDYVSESDSSIIASLLYVAMGVILLLLKQADHHQAQDQYFYTSMLVIVICALGIHSAVTNRWLLEANLRDYEPKRGSRGKKNENALRRSLKTMSHALMYSLVMSSAAIIIFKAPLAYPPIRRATDVLTGVFGALVILEALMSYAAHRRCMAASKRVERVIDTMLAALEKKAVKAS